MSNQQVIDAPKLSEVAIFNPIEQGIALILEKHGGVLTSPPDVSTAKALAATKKNRAEMVTFRTAIEATRKSEKQASLDYGRLVDSEAKRITAIAAPIELAYDKAVTEEENRIEAIRQAEIEAERQRIAGHKARIQTIKDVRGTANLCRTSDRLNQLIDGMPAMVELSFEEFGDEAMTAFNETCTLLSQLHAAKVEQETAATELARQQAELAAQRAEQARIDLEAQALRDKQEADAKVARDAEAATIQKRADDLAAREAEVSRREAVAAAPMVEQKTFGEQIAAYAQAVAPAPVKVVPNIRKPMRPTDIAITEALALHYRVHESKVLEWLMDMDFPALGRHIESEFTGAQA